MILYKYTFLNAGNIYEGEFESENNEEAKREAKKRTKLIGVPSGKYIFVTLIKTEDSKKIVDEELWAV